MNKNKTVIIYLPNGTEAKFTTSQEVAGTEYVLAKTIECELNSVNIALLEDGKVKGESYVGMPYYLEMF
jgi:hypothetical protein